MAKGLRIAILAVLPSPLTGRTLWAGFLCDAEGANSSIEPGGGLRKLDPSKGSGSNDVILAGKSQQ